MTVKQYISDKLSVFGKLSEAELADFASRTGIELSSDYSIDNADSVGVGLVFLIEEKALAPRTESVSEGGFSFSVNFDGVGRYYVYLCRRFGISPNDEVSAMLGVSGIVNRSDIW